MAVYGADTVGATKVFPDYNKTFAGMSGSAGFTYNATENFSFKANIARGFRAPNIAEISSNGVHPGNKFLPVGQSQLQT